MVLEAVLRLVLPVVLVVGLVLLLLPRPAGRMLGRLLGLAPSANGSARSRRLRRLRTTSGVVSIVGGLIAAKALEAVLVGGANALTWVLGAAAVALILGGVVGVRITSRRLVLEGAPRKPRRVLGRSD